MTRSVRIAALFVAAALISSGAFAAPRAAPTKREPGLRTIVWKFLGSLVPAIEKARGSRDPDGVPASSTPTEDDSEARGSMDPDG